MRLPHDEARSVGRPEILAPWYRDDLVIKAKNDWPDVAMQLSFLVKIGAI